MSDRFAAGAESGPGDDVHTLATVARRRRRFVRLFRHLTGQSLACHPVGAD